MTDYAKALMEGLKILRIQEQTIKEFEDIFNDMDKQIFNETKCIHIVLDTITKDIVAVGNERRNSFVISGLVYDYDTIYPVEIIRNGAHCYNKQELEKELINLLCDTTIIKNFKKLINEI